MPKKRSEVVADRERRMSRVVNGEIWMPDSVPIKREIKSPPMLMVVDELVEPEDDGSAAFPNDPSIMVRNVPSVPISVSASKPTSTSALASAPAAASKIAPSTQEAARKATSAQAMPSNSMSKSASELAATVRRPLPPLRAESDLVRAPHRSRRTRSMSLSSTPASEIEPFMSNDEPTPPPAIKVEVIRRQKSLKKLFFSHYDSASVQEKQDGTDKKPKGLLSRAKSKPSLRIDVKASKEDFVPGIATASSSGQSEGFPGTPVSRSSDGLGHGHRGLSKRFSLSNMSNAFKKKSPAAGEGLAVPKVPELPEAYRREKEAMEIEIALSVSYHVVPASPPLEGEIVPQEDDEPDTKGLATPEEPMPKYSVKGLMSPPIIHSAVHTHDAESETSSAFDFDDELEHAELMQVSPRTRRNPGVSLQQFLGQAPGRRIRVENVDNASRHSVEAIVLGSLLVPEAETPSTGGERSHSEVLAGGKQAPQAVPSSSEASLGSLSQSSYTSEPDAPPITPNILEANPLSPPIELTGLQLPTLSNDIIAVESPPTSSTRASSPKPRAFGSPDIFLHMFSSPRSSSRIVKPTPTPTASYPTPPLPEWEVQFSSLSANMQLKSLHFDGLGLDFDGFSREGRHLI